MDADAQVQFLLAFLNTLDVEHASDVLDDVEGFVAWSAQRGRVAGSVATARALRDALRTGLERPGDATGPALPAYPDVALALEASPDGGPRLRVHDVAGEVAAIAVGLVADGRWGRLKLCPADDCREAFYDSSRNHSRTWCDMADCGNLAKVRSYRRRARS